MSVNAARTSCAVIPATSTNLARDVPPRTMRSAPFDAPIRFANNLITASFAAESTGGAVTLIFRTSPSVAPI